MKITKSSAFSLLLCLILLCVALSSCANFAEDARIGVYLSDTDGYTMCLYADGTGEISFVSTIDGEHKEAFHFTIREDELLITGTATSGGVLGRSQYSGILEEVDGLYRVTLYNEDTALTLGTFHQQGETK